MALSYIEYTGDGSTNSFSVPFEYIAQADIKVFVDGVEDTSVTFTSQSIVQTSTTPSAGALVRVERNTDITSRAVDFASGSILTEEDLDDSNTQVFFAAQEAIDTANDALSTSADGKFNAEVGGVNRIIKNVADPTDPQDVTTKGWVEDTWLTPSDKAQLNAIDTTKLHTVANDIANVNTTAGNIGSVNTTAGSITNVNTTAGSIANVNTTAANIADVNTVATNIGDINTVENSIANVDTVALNITDVNTVATNIGDINTVENSILNVDTVATSIGNVNSVAGNNNNVTTVANNIANVNITAGDINNVNAVGTNISNVNAVAGNETNINAVQANAANINAVNANAGNINTVAGNNANVTTVANNIADVQAAAINMADIQEVSTEVQKVITVANDLNEATSEIETVAASIANVDAVGTNIGSVSTVANNLTSVNAFAETYSIAATAPTGATEGDLWFDTASDMMMVYNGGSWQTAGSSVNGTAARFKFTATASQTAFSGADANSNTLAYDAGYIDVYLNGVHLDPSDYTATDGSTITLAAGAAAGDELYVVAFGTFTLANHYTSSQVDSLLAGISSDALIDSGGTTRVQATTSGADVTGTVTAGAAGIGTSSPNRILDVRSSQQIAATFHSTGANAAISLKASGTADDDNNQIAVTADDMWFRTNGSERMRIDSSGKVGIGTTSPNHPLTVSNVANNSGVRVDGGSGQNNTSLMLTNSGVNKGFRVNYNVTGDALIINNTTGDGAYGGTECMRIDSAGRVTMPYQPAFCAYRNSLYTSASGDHEVDINVATLNVGNGYNTSTNRFTAPVAGVYKFDAAISFNHSSASSLQTQDDSQYLTFRKNGAEINGRNAGSQSVMLNSGYLTKSGVEASTTFTAIMSLSAGDYISVEYGDIQSPVTITNANFNGYLLG